MEVDLFHEQIGLGDVVFLSSDGMHGVIEDAEIAKIFSQLPLDRAVRRLIDLANERGGPDNITVVAAQLTISNGVETPTNDVETPIIDATLPPPPVIEPIEPIAEPVEATGASVMQVAASQPLERPLSRVGLSLALFALVVLLALAVLALRPDWVGLAPPTTPAAPTEIDTSNPGAPLFLTTPSPTGATRPTDNANMTSVVPTVSP